MANKTILGASIGNCVHVAGVIHFLDLAEKEGYEAHFMGPATPVEDLMSAVAEWKPDYVAVGYRLTPENVRPLLDMIDAGRAGLGYNPVWVFGGTKPVADIAEEYGFFSFISDGYDELSDSIRFLRGLPIGGSPEAFGGNLVDRISVSYPFPILRHHYGRPTMRETLEGISKISEAGVLDVISLGPDQNAQEFLFKPELMRSEYDGAGGVPFRTASDLKKLKAASLTGNYPLMRSYSGTEDVFEYAELLRETIDNAWTAIPLSWYNELDGRGSRSLEQSMREAMRLISWHAKRGVPVEINEPHHWGLRDAHDVIPVAMAYICAYNAKRLGVRDYIAQYMFNNPNGLSFSMDLAKVLAMIELAESLMDADFRMYRETRAGLALLSADPDVAKGQLAASTFMQMAVKPHIIHVVGFSEADHAARAEEVIESCRIVKGVVRHTVDQEFSMSLDASIVQRKKELVSEARVLLDFIKSEYCYSDDPLGDPDVLCDCIRKGYIDAVHIVKNDKFTGDLKTRLIDGKCLSVDPSTGKPWSESDRLSHLKSRYESSCIEMEVA